MHQCNNTILCAMIIPYPDIILCVLIFHFDSVDLKLYIDTNISHN